MATKVKDVVIDGTRYEVSVSESGRFSAEVGSDVLEANTLDTLVAKLTKAARVGVVPMPVTSYETDHGKVEFTDLELVGFRRGRSYHEMLLRDLKGEEVDRYYGTFCRRLTDEEKKKLVRLCLEAHRAQDALLEFEDGIALGTPRQAFAKFQAEHRK